MAGDDHNGNLKGGSRYRRLFQLLRLTGIILFVIILTRVDIQELWYYMKGVDRGMLLLAIFFQLLVLFFKAARWQFLNYEKDWRSGWIKNFGEFFESYAIGVITPGRMGELMKAGYAGHRPGIVNAAIRVLVERGLDIGIFLVIAGGSLAFSQLIDIPEGWGWLVLAAGIAAAITAILLLVSKRTLGLMNRWLLRFRILKEPVPFRQRNPKEKWMIILLAILSNLSYFISCYFLGMGLGMGAAFLYLSGGVAIAGLLNMLPITVMGLGTRELTFIFVFNEFLRAQVLAFSGLVFLVAQIGGGLISLILGELFLLSKKSAKHG